MIQERSPKLISKGLFVFALKIAANPIKIAILNPINSYWSAAAKWNNYYCKLHGHVFLYYTIRGTALREIVGDIPHGRRKLLADDVTSPGRRAPSKKKKRKIIRKQCYYDRNNTVESWNMLATPWCKVSWLFTNHAR